MQLRAECGTIDQVHNLRRVKLNEAVNQAHAHRFEQAARAIVGLLRDRDHHGRRRADRLQRSDEHGGHRLPGVSMAPVLGQE